MEARRLVVQGPKMPPGVLDALASALASAVKAAPNPALSPITATTKGMEFTWPGLHFPLLSPHPTSPFGPSAMDYSYFNPGPQPYQYFAMAQTTAQPMDMDSFHSQPAPPPPPPSQQPPPHFNTHFAAFQDSFHYDPSNYMHTTAAQSQPPSRAPSRHMTHAPSISPGIPYESVPMSTTESVAPEEGLPHRSSSEEFTNMTPQQSKRKAQNRAAQRAFRERKEQHLKKLEIKLNTNEQQLMSLDSENERLRKELARVATEYETLKATTHTQPSLGEDDESFGPLGYQTTALVPKQETVARRAQMLGSIHTIVIDDNSGELLLNTNQTWDYIQAHESCREGIVDIGDAMERLKKLARCDGHGPVFQESDIRRAISESAVAGGRDELL